MGLSQPSVYTLKIALQSMFCCSRVRAISIRAWDVFLHEIYREFAGTDE